MKKSTRHRQTPKGPPRQKPAPENPIVLTGEQEVQKWHHEKLMEMVTERTNELRLLNEEFRTIFQGLPLGIVYLDREFNIIRANRFFCDLISVSEEEILGKPCYDTVGEHAADTTKKDLEKICTFCKKSICFTDKKPAIIERPLGVRFIRVTTIPELNESGDIVRFLEIVEDITNRKQAEAEVIRMGHLAAIGELAAGVAHEINNPVNGIINYAQILANKSTAGSKEHEISGRIIKESDRIVHIVDNLLSFAKGSSEERRMVCIDDILHESLSLTGAMMRKDGIKLTVNIPPGLPRVIAHPQQIEQVFLNVLSNARYALSQRYPAAHNDKVIEITAGEIKADNASFVQIIFHDRGTGIPPKVLDRIMNPFFSTKPPSAGTGLGLSISHGIISSHHGRIKIESSEGAFTNVVVELPSADGANSEVCGFDNEEMQNGKT